MFCSVRMRKWRYLDMYLQIYVFWIFVFRSVDCLITSHCNQLPFFFLASRLLLYLKGKVNEIKGNQLLIYLISSPRRHHCHMELTD